MAGLTLESPRVRAAPSRVATVPQDAWSAFVALLIATVFAIVGMALLPGAWPSLGLFLTVAGGAWVGRATGLEVCAAPLATAIAGMSRRWLVLTVPAVLMVVAGALSVQQRTAWPAWAYAGCVVALIAAALWIDGASRPRLGRIVEYALYRWRDLALTVFVAAAALGVRVWRWDSVPGNIPDDEFGVVWYASMLLEGRRAATPFDVTHLRIVELHSHIAALFLALGAEAKLALMLTGAIPGAVAVVATYLLVRDSFGLAPALVAAGLLGLNRANVLLTRMGFDYAVSLGLGVLALWLTMRAFRSGRLTWYVLVGVTIGLELVYLWVGVIAAAWVGLAWLLIAARDRSARWPALLGLIVAAVVSLVIASPRLIASLANPSNPSGVAYQQGVFVGGSLGPLEVARLAADAFLGFVHSAKGPPYMTFGTGAGPLFDPVSALLAPVGVGFLAYHARRGPAGLWLGVGVLGILVSAVSTGVGASSWRLIMAMPALAVGSALVLAGLARVLSRGSPALAPIGWLVMASVVGFPAVSTYQDYFLDYRARPDIWSWLRGDSLPAARWLRARADTLGRAAVIAPDYQRQPQFQLTAPASLSESPGYQRVDSWRDVPFPMPMPETADRVWLLTGAEPWQSFWPWVGVYGIRQIAQAYYTGGGETLERAFDGRDLFYVTEWPGTSVAGRQGLRRDASATCPGAAAAGGWRGLLYVPARGTYRLRVDADRACARLDLRSADIVGRTLVLTRGWHQITLVAPGGSVPALHLETDDRSLPVPPHHLFSGDQARIGFETYLSLVAGEPPLERRFVPFFDVSWHELAPGPTVHARLRGEIELSRPATALVFEVVGPLVVTVDGERLLNDPGRSTRLVVVPRALAAGRHTLEIEYTSVGEEVTRGRIRGEGWEQRLDLSVLRSPSVELAAPR